FRRAGNRRVGDTGARATRSRAQTPSPRAWPGVLSELSTQLGAERAEELGLAAEWAYLRRQAEHAGDAARKERMACDRVAHHLARTTAPDPVTNHRRTQLQAEARDRSFRIPK